MKIVKYTLFTLVTLWWFFLSHVTFTTSWFYSVSLENENYSLSYYRPAPTNLFGLYFWLVNEMPRYAVLYNKKGDYLGQSSPFLIASAIHTECCENVLPETYESDKKHERYDKFYIRGGPFDERYTISTKDKKWWSQILQYFHQIKRDGVLPFSRLHHYMGSYVLGAWGKLYRDYKGYVPVFNDDFRRWQKEHNEGGDFIAFSDVYWIDAPKPYQVIYENR